MWSGSINQVLLQATQYLDAHDWDLLAATNSYFQDDDEEHLEGKSEAPQTDNYTGPRTLDGRPAPQAASSSAGKRSAPPPKRRGVATLGSVGGGPQKHNDDDSDENSPDDDGRGNLFAGGEKSALAVQDPRQDNGGPKKLINDILAKARSCVLHLSAQEQRLTIDSNAGRPEAESEDAGPAPPSYFRGTGVTLGGDGVESRSIPDPSGAAPAANTEPQERVLHIWEDGFSIDDGELRRFDDPANQADLAMIRTGRAPLHLMNVHHDQPIDVKLHQHEEPYKPQPKKYKPFSGSGQRLGSPVPGAGTSAPPPATSSAPARAPTSALASTVSNAGSGTEPAIDSSQPTVMIRIQMPDGTRLPARFNTTSTIGDVYGFVQSASPETNSRAWVLATTFPNKEHTDKDLTLADTPEFKKGGTAVVKWA